MLAYRDIRYLSPLRSVWNYIVTIAAPHAPVIAVGEYPPKVVLRHGCAAIWCQLVTNAARCDLTIRRVAGITVIVGLDTGRYSLSRSRRRVAKCASVPGTPLPAFMSGMVEPHVETFLELGGECIHGRLVRVER